MTKNQRINLLVSAEERADIDARAERAGVTVSEFLRRAALAYEPEVDIEMLSVLSEEIGAMGDRLSKRLDESYEAVMAGGLSDDEIERIKRETREAVERGDIVIPPFLIAPTTAPAKGDV